jgi:6-phosphofructokinase 1
MQRIGVLTSGGDAPGMNTAIRAVARAADAHRAQTVGFEDGYDGLIDGRVRPLTARDVGGIMHLGGTVLRTARSKEMLTEEGQRRAVRTLRQQGVEGLVVIGGDGSLRGAHALAGRGIPVVGIPASIDNDIWGTNMSLGVDSALNTIVDAMDKLRDTASSHQRAFLIETMGRECGYLAVLAALIGGAETAVVPEAATTVDELGDIVRGAYDRGKYYCFVIVAEGAPLDVREIAAYLEETGIGFEARITTLGHVQRGGRPSAFDRMLASRMGVRAVAALSAGQSDVMTALQGRSIELEPLAVVTARARTPSLEYLEMTEILAR